MGGRLAINVTLHQVVISVLKEKKAPKKGEGLFAGEQVLLLHRWCTVKISLIIKH